MPQAVHTRVWSAVTCSNLLQLSFQLHLPSSPHHHLWVGDASSEAWVGCGIVQPFGDVLLVAGFAPLRFLRTLLQLFLLTTRQSTLEIRRRRCRVGRVSETTPLHVHKQKTWQNFDSRENLNNKLNDHWYVLKISIQNCFAIFLCGYITSK